MKHDKEFAQHLTTPQSALAFAKALLGAKSSAERRYYEFLIEVEARPDLWSLYAPTFSTYLYMQHLGNAAGFEEYKKGRATLSSEVIDAIGVSAVRASSRVRDAKTRVACIAKMQDTVKREQVPLSKFTADRIAKSFDPEVSTSTKEAGVPTYVQLEREVVRLRRKVAKLEESCAAYKARLAKLHSSPGVVAPLN